MSVFKKDSNDMQKLIGVETRLGAKKKREKDKKKEEGLIRGWEGGARREASEYLFEVQAEHHQHAEQ